MRKNLLVYIGLPAAMSAAVLHAIIVYQIAVVVFGDKMPDQLAGALLGLVVGLVFVWVTFPRKRGE